MAAHTLVIKVTAGKDEPERCDQALTVASTAIASGVAVSLWLAGEAAWFALPGRADDFSLPHAAPLADLLARCGPRHGDCLHAVRGPPGHHAAGRDRRDQIAGAATFVSEVVADGRRRSSTDARAGLATVPLTGGDRREALLAQPLCQFLGLRRQRRQRPGRPGKQQVGQARVADQRRAVQVGADHPARVGALGAVAVPHPGPERRASGGTPGRAW